MFLGLLEMTFGLVYASFSLPKLQALKMTFYAPCRSTKRTMKFNLLRKFCEPCSQCFVQALNNGKPLQFNTRLMASVIAAVILIWIKKQ